MLEGIGPRMFRENENRGPATRIFARGYQFEKGHKTYLLPTEGDENVVRSLHVELVPEPFMGPDHLIHLKLNPVRELDEIRNAATEIELNLATIQNSGFAKSEKAEIRARFLRRYTQLAKSPLKRKVALLMSEGYRLIPRLHRAPNEALEDLNSRERRATYARLTELEDLRKFSATNPAQHESRAAVSEQIARYIAMARRELGYT